jgi:hypothetical protein
MSIEIKVVDTKKDLKKFIMFPFELYKKDPYWTPPLLSDEYSYYNVKKNKNLAENPYIQLLAYKEGKLVGRVMGLINTRANRLRNEKIARFTYLDTINSESVTHALLDKVTSWSRKYQMSHLIGPRGFSDQEPQGAVIEGFKKRAQIGTIHNKEHLVKHLDSYGFVKDVDWVNYNFPIPTEFPKTVKYIFQRLKKSTNFKVKNFKSKAELKLYIKPIIELLNETYKDIYGFSPMTDSEVKAVVKKYLPVLDPKLVHVIEDSGKLIAFSIVMPDVTPGLQKAKGKLFPFGFLHVLKSFKSSDTVQLLLVGIKEEYRGKGFFAIFAEQVIYESRLRNISRADSHLQLENNTSMRKWMDLFQAEIDRRYRAFKKEL